ncbi:hypothetical protein OG535_12585 [Kitasatospora sp. NBC_00085]|uniref:hypothetical protein n=1 Tax=Kitasatospora sp. NBC_00085 TaxID=2903566 RepID=UPI0032543868
MHPVIAVVGAQKITYRATPAVAVTDAEQIGSILPSRPEELPPARLEQIFRIARHRYVWGQIGKRST